MRLKKLLAGLATSAIVAGGMVATAAVPAMASSNACVDTPGNQWEEGHPAGWHDPNAQRLERSYVYLSPETRNAAPIVVTERFRFTKNNRTESWLGLRYINQVGQVTYQSVRESCQQTPPPPPPPSGGGGGGVSSDVPRAYYGVSVIWAPSYSGSATVGEPEPVDSVAAR